MVTLTLGKFVWSDLSGSTATSNPSLILCMTCSYFSRFAIPLDLDKIYILPSLSDLVFTNEKDMVANGDKKKKNKLWKKYRSIRSPGDLSNSKSTNNELRSLTRSLRRNYEQHLVQNIDSKPKVFWLHIKSRLKICPSISEILSPIGSAVCSEFWKGFPF